MNFFQQSRRYLSQLIAPTRLILAEAAYDSWATSYDHQPDNLMLALDEEIFSLLIHALPLENKRIADIGCGTGRHWQKLMAAHPQRLIGFDVSEGMLTQLHQKFPDADTYHIDGTLLPQVPDQSVDIIVSTLMLAHIRSLEGAMKEWVRILKPGGHLILTDFHPDALSKGGKRTFRHEGKTVAIKNYIHPVSIVKDQARQLHLEVIRLEERTINLSTRPFYERQHKLSLYEKWKGEPIIYGIHLKKTDATL